MLIFILYFPILLLILNIKLELVKYLKKGNKMGKYENVGINIKQISVLKKVIIKFFFHTYLIKRN